MSWTTLNIRLGDVEALWSRCRRSIRMTVIRLPRPLSGGSRDASSPSQAPAVVSEVPGPATSTRRAARPMRRCSKHQPVTVPRQANQERPLGRRSSDAVLRG